MRTSQELNQILTKEFLIEEYINKDQSVLQLAKIVGCSYTTIYEKIKKHGLSLKNSSKLEDITKEFLIENYTIKSLSTQKIAKIFNCSPTSIMRKLYEYNIIVRKKGNIKGKKLVFVNPKERSNKISKALTGKKRAPFSDEWKKNMSKSRDKGLVSLNMSIRNLSEYYVWKREVFKKDNNKCQECNETKKELEAHHIKPFYLILHEFLKQFPSLTPLKNKKELQELARSYKPFWEVNNGKTVCYDCHDIIEKKGINEFSNLQ